MLYSSPEFFLLFLLTWTIYVLSWSERARFSTLLAASLIFYAWAGVFDSLIFVFVVMISWLSVWIARKRPRLARFAVPGGITVMALHLFFWKYAAWATTQIQLCAPSFLGGRHPTIPLPVGISFFTLQGIAYLIDFGRGEAEFMSFREYLLFKSFFAQLIAGPIVRARQLLPQLRRLTRPTTQDMSRGLALFTLGFLKKTLLADRIAAIIDPVFRNPHNYGRAALLAGLLGYTIQIWADFSGYTDMGRACARMLGITLPENFLSPYLAKKPSEFWRRWHITLSEWIRDYIYIPLGGGRGATVKVLGVVTVTMALSGLWHGANWTFIIWGLYHGCLLIAERELPDVFGVLPRRIADTVKRITLFAAIAVGWLIFRSQDLASIWEFIFGLAHAQGGILTGSHFIYIGAAICLLLETLLYRNLETGRQPVVAALQSAWTSVSNDGKAAWVPFVSLGAGCVLAATLFTAIALRPENSRAFIYFQF